MPDETPKLKKTQDNDALASAMQSTLGLIPLLEERSGAERQVLDKAVRWSLKAHEGQQRASGEPYSNHTLAVAQILNVGA